MAAPTFVASGALSTGTGAVSPALPAGRATDDILLLFCETVDGTAATPSGWAVAGARQWRNAGQAALNTCLDVYWRRVVGGESAPSLADAGDHISAVIHAYRGCETSGDPWDEIAGATEANDTSASFPSVTTVGADRLIVMSIATHDNVGAPLSGASNANLTGVSIRTNEETSSGNDGTLAVVTGVMASAGATGETSATLAFPVHKALATIALKPPGAPPGPTGVSSVGVLIC